MRRTILFGSSLVTAFAASLCCILPLIAAMGGVAVLGVAATFESYRPYLLFATAVLLLGGAIVAYRDYRRGCRPGSVCETKPVTRLSVLSLGVLATLVVFLATFPYYAGSVVQAFAAAPDVKSAPSGKKESAGSLRTVQFGISGMTCPSCARGLEASFQNMPGVKEAKINYDKKQATVRFDPEKQTEEAVKKLVADAGYTVTAK